MGIRNLHDFLRKTVPDVYEEISLSQLAFKTIAIDLSIYLCKYKSGYKERWVDAFLNLMCTLRENDIHFIFIFDSKSPPEKDDEKRMRMMQRERLKQRVHELRTSIEQYEKDCVLTPLIDQCLKKKNALHVPFKESIRVLWEEADRMSSNILDIQSSDFELLKELFQILSVPYYWAHSEAEATCAHLCLNGIVHAVLTEDTDILAYGCPLFLHKINLNNSTISQVNMSKMLKALGLNYPEFLDFCIMCGTDYNQNIRNIGNERSFRLIREYKSIDRIPNINTTVLNHKRVRDLFRNDIDYRLPCYGRVVCGYPDQNDLHFFLFNNNCSTPLQRIMNAFVRRTYHLDFSR